MGEISNKVQESRLKSHGDVLRREYVCTVQESDGDGGAGEKERKTKADVVG